MANEILALRFFQKINEEHVKILTKEFQFYPALPQPQSNTIGVFTT